MYGCKSKPFRQTKLSFLMAKVIELTELGEWFYIISPIYKQKESIVLSAFCTNSSVAYRPYIQLLLISLLVPHLPTQSCKAGAPGEHIGLKFQALDMHRSQSERKTNLICCFLPQTRVTESLLAGRALGKTPHPTSHWLAPPPACFERMVLVDVGEGDLPPLNNSYLRVWTQRVKVRGSRVSDFLVTTGVFSMMKMKRIGKHERKMLTA